MSLIKKLIQRLLDSRTTPNEAAHSAMPSYDDNAVIEITPIKTTTDGWEKAASFVATSDGYVLVQGTARNDNVCQLSVDNSKNIKTVMEILRANSTTYFVTPATKGSTVQVFGHYMTNITIKLTKAIGGGYNILVRRALSCLRPSFNCLSRSFFKVNIPTLLINADQVPVHKARQSQETARRISWLHSQVGQSLRLAQTVRQTTHGLGLKTPPEELHTSPMQFANTKRLLSQCKKEIFLLLTSALITRTKALFCLSLLKQQNNFGTGGMTC